ncbi:RNA guanine-N7 methyltransferase activating subunit isoform X2 [Gallus gallus]|uniref:RNA guanine-N7 methyltransferase activating subunit isoform X2 n=1 Tax=Gallus gallus TaxID=9031 RepID=UPI001F0163AD|nr:RNA guanine-N7 methyltransferase activating subunit isoform X2 [Gallus gallus]
MAVHPAARKASPRFAHTEVSASQRTCTHTASSTTAVPRPQNRAPTKPAKERTADILYAIHTSARSAPNSGLAEPNPQATAARGAPALRHPALSRHRKRRGAHRKSRALRAAAAGGAGCAKVGCGIGIAFCQRQPIQES